MIARWKPKRALMRAQLVYIGQRMRKVSQIFSSPLRFSQNRLNSVLFSHKERTHVFKYDQLKKS
jgi:hypothetical protein